MEKERVELRVLTDLERKDIEVVMEAGGEMLQREISWKTGYSRVKTHRVLVKRVRRGLVTEEKHTVPTVSSSRIGSSRADPSRTRKDNQRRVACVRSFAEPPAFISANGGNVPESFVYRHSDAMMNVQDFVRDKINYGSLTQSGFGERSSNQKDAKRSIRYDIAKSLVFLADVCG